MQPQPDAPAGARRLHPVAQPPEPDPDALWAEAEPLIEPDGGLLVIDDSTLDKPHARHIGLVTRHWSGKHRRVVKGINLISLVWTDGDRKFPIDYRLFRRPTACPSTTTSGRCC